MSAFDNWRPPEEKERNWFNFGDGPREGHDTFSGGVMADVAYEREAAREPAWPVGGWAASAVSGVGELFGMEPSTAVQVWRDQNPIGDLTSQLAGIFVPYAGWEIGTARIPAYMAKLEKVTEGTLKAFGTTSASAPIRAGALKEFFRYTPLELSRLGSGWAMDADMGEMFADVAITQALAGALGGVGGFLRAGGRALTKGGQVAGAEEGLLPTFEFRMAQEPNATILGDVDPAQFRYDKKMEALRYVPENAFGEKGLKGRYFYEVEDLTPETTGFFEKVMRPNPSNITQEGLAASPFDVRQLHTDNKLRSVGVGVGETIAQEAGFKSLDELAETLVYPRHITVQDTRFGAGVMGGQMQKAVSTGGLKRIADDTWMMQEDGGLWVVMKRLERGPEPPKPAKGRRPAYQFGPAQVRVGDRWLMGKTDLPGKFAPEADLIQKGTLKTWAKQKDPYRQLATLNPFGQEMNMIQKVLDPTDWNAARKLRKTTWMAKVGSKIAAKLKEEAGLVDQAHVEALANRLYDVVVPKAHKVQGDSMYGRLYSLLEGTMRYADETLNRVMQGVVRSEGSQTAALGGRGVKFEPHDGYEPVRELWAKLDDAERQLVVAAAHTQTPAEDLAKLAGEGSISPAATQAVAQLQAINKNVLERYVLPALDEAGLGGEFKWLDGYILPRIFKGDFMMRVVDDADRPMWIASGTTPKAAQRMADTVIEEAAKEGKTWKALKVESKAFKGAGEADNLDAIYGMVHEQLGQSADAQATVQKALRRLLAEQASTPSPGRAPRTLTKERSGIPGAPDVEHYSLEDVIKASENHYRQLLRYAAFHSWKHRFGNTALKWGKNNDVAYTDLMRKASQWLGAEGQLTTTINKLLAPVLGPALGQKAGTRIAQATNSLMYAWNLGILNPTFALLNLLTPLQTTAPWIAFMQRAPIEEASRLMQQELRFDSRGVVRGTVGVLSPIKLLHEATAMMSKPSAELRQFFDQAVIDGTLSPQIYDEWIGSTARNVHSLKEAAGRNGWEFIKETATLLSTRSEQYSRTIAFNSAYLLGKDFFRLEGDALYRFARKGTETTMYGYSVMDRSRILTGPAGSMFGLFKNWQFHFIGSMMQYAGLGWREGIWSPLLWQMGAATALGGLGATPLVMAADGLAKWSSDSPNSFHWLMKNWEGPAGDALYFGLPALAGVSLQASSVLPGTDIPQDIESLTNVVFYERAKAAWASIGAAADQWEGTGRNPLRDANIRDQLMQAFAPRVVNRLFSGIEGDYIKSMSTGYPTVRGLSPVTKVLHQIGLNQSDIEKHYIAGEFLYEKQQKRRDAIQDLGAAFAQARLNRDGEAMSSIVRRAMATGVPVSSVLQSAETRYRRETQGEHLSRFDWKDRQEWERLVD